ncbi:MAG TPA: phosphoribosyltransferase family protein [Actinomycetes bacterium]|nr:phosphoribosyltransferase family protein [Actinomycetes bacterium]
MSREFVDRVDAGRRLGDTLAADTSLRRAEPIVLGLPRGGVVVAAEVAERLGAPLDVLVVRKLGVPGHEELAFGAVARGGHRVLNPAVVAGARLTDVEIDAITGRELAVVESREQRLRGHGTHPSLAGRTVVVVDDGIATGATLRAALDVLRAEGPARLVVAVPVAPADAMSWLRSAADDVVVLEAPRDFYAVGQAYQDFGQTSDEEVAALLAGRGG